MKVRTDSRAINIALPYHDGPCTDERPAKKTFCRRCHLRSFLDMKDAPEMVEVQIWRPYVPKANARDLTLRTDPRFIVPNVNRQGR